MKKVIVYIALFLFVASCTKQAPELETINFEARNGPLVGYNFRQVDIDYENHPQGIYLVNDATGVGNIGGQHWVFTSPSLNNKEVGFGIVAHPDCLDTPCDVVVFLHATGQTENAGASRLYDQYINNYPDSRTVFLFANGIGADEGAPIGPAVWKQRDHRETGETIDPLKTVWELIGGIIEADLYPYMKKNMSDWSVIGFSAGASATLGVYMDPMFVNSPYQPRKIMPFGGFLVRSSLVQYMDYDGGRLLWKDCTERITDLIVANHFQDDVNCDGGNTTYEVTKPLIDEMVAEEVPLIFLGLNHEVDPLCAVNPEGFLVNRTHSVSFHLNNEIGPSEQIVTCRSSDYLDPFEQVSDLLYD